MSAPRERLPDRRMQVVEELTWAGRPWLVGYGFDAGGRVREAFVSGSRTGAELQALVEDACVLVSLLLQCGMPAPELARHLAREGVDPAAPAASLIGLIVERTAVVEARDGAEVRQAYEALDHGEAPHRASDQGGTHGPGQRASRS